MAPPIRRVPVTSAAGTVPYTQTYTRGPMRIDGSTRRRFLGRAAGVGLAAAALLTDDALARAAAAVDRAGDRDPEDIARDESFWREIQLGFTLDRSIINLNNGGVSPSPRVVHEAYKRYLDVSNQSPAYHMWQV